MDEFDDMMKMLGIEEEDEPSKPPARPSDDDDDGGLSALNALNSLNDMDTIGDVDADNLDDELERLLAADQVADEEQDFEEITAESLVSTRSVYDSGGIVEEATGNTLVYSREDAEAEARKRNKRSLLDGMTVSRLLKISAILVFIFIAVGVSIVLTSRAVEAQRAEVAEMLHFTAISMPADTANNTNFIHVNEQINIGGRYFTLSSISVGSSGTYFFFEEHFNTRDYIIMLYDQNRHLYVRQQFDLNHPAAMGTILRFDPLRHDTLFLTLHIQNLETRAYGNFYYRLVGSFIFGAPIFINQPIPLFAGGDINSGLRISHARFNNIESVIYYSFNGNFSSLGLRQRENATGTFVHLWDNFGGLANMTKGQATIYCDERDAMVGRATFAPLVSLHAPIRATFHDLYYVYPYPDVDIPLRFLSGRNQDDPHVLQMETFQLNLEGIQQQGHLLVMVMHGTDESGLRLRTYVDASLEIDIGRGEVLTIPAAMVNVSPPGATYIGTDVVFNLQAHLAELANVHIDRYTLILHTVEFSVPEVSVTIDLAYAVHHPGNRRENVTANIHTAFMSRLAYKSGEIAHNAIIGFAPDVLADAALSPIFAQRSLPERPMYGVTVVAGDFYDNYTFLAVVESEWAVGSGANLEFVRFVHQIIARSHEGIWSVVSDKLLPF